MAKNISLMSIYARVGFMKRLLIGLLTLSSLTTFAHAAPKKCYSTAEKSVEKYAIAEGYDYYDMNGFDAHECSLATNGAAIVCEVLAAKGDGAAYDTYRVVLNKTCSKTFRVELIGEE